MKPTLPTLLSLFPLLAWGTLESRQGRCNIIGNEDVDCMLYPLAKRVVRTIPPGTGLSVTCQMPGRPSEPYVHQLYNVQRTHSTNHSATLVRAWDYIAQWDCYVSSRFTSHHCEGKFCQVIRL